MSRPRANLVAIACAVIAVLAGLGAILASQDGSLHPSALVKISDQDPIAGLAKSADPHFRLVNLPQHYDGTYYYAVARDPFLRGQAHTLIDQPAYRYGHPLHGWLAGALSVGQARAVPVALLVLSLVGMALGGWTISRLAVHFGRSAWGGLVVAASPGLLYSTTVDTTEALGAALLALTMLAWLNRRFAIAAVLIVMLCLDKEQFVTVPIGLALWELIEARRARARPTHAALKTVALVIGPAVLAGWYIYIRGRLDAWPWSYEPGNMGKPFTGWIDSFQMAHGLAGGDFNQAQIGNLTPVVLIAVAVILLIAFVMALRVRTILDLPLITGGEPRDPGLADVPSRLFSPHHPRSSCGFSRGGSPAPQHLGKRRPFFPPSPQAPDSGATAALAACVSPPTPTENTPPAEKHEAAEPRLPRWRLCARPGDEHPAAGRERPGQRPDRAQVRADKTRPPNSQDQLGKYENLLYGYQGLKNSQLSKYYNDESFGVRAKDVARTEMPSSDVAIR